MKFYHVKIYVHLQYWYLVWAPHTGMLTNSITNSWHSVSGWGSLRTAICGQKQKSSNQVTVIVKIQSAKNPLQIGYLWNQKHKNPDNAHNCEIYMPQNFWAYSINYSVKFCWNLIFKIFWKEMHLKLPYKPHTLYFAVWTLHTYIDPLS